MATPPGRERDQATPSSSARPEQALLAMGQRLRAARARARIPADAEWAPPRRRASQRRGIARDDLVAYVEYRFGLPNWSTGYQRATVNRIRLDRAAGANGS